MSRVCPSTGTSSAGSVVLIGCSVTNAAGMIGTSSIIERYVCASLKVRAKSAAVISSAAAKKASGTHASNMPINSGAPRWNLIPRS